MTVFERLIGGATLALMFGIPIPAQPVGVGSSAERVEALVAEARKFLRLEIFPEAMQALSEARAIDPLNPQVHFWTGHVALEQGDRETAQQEFRVALNIEPESFSPHFALAGISISTIGEEPSARTKAAEHLRSYRAARESADADAFSTENLVQFMDERATEFEAAVRNLTGKWSFHGSRTVLVTEQPDEIVLIENSSGSASLIGTGRLTRHDGDRLTGTYQALLQDGCTYTEALTLHQSADGMRLDGVWTMQKRSRKGVCRRLVKVGHTEEIVLRRKE